MDMDRDSGFVGRLEVVDTGRRRRWSLEEKVRIVEESLAGHRQASATARRYDIPNGLLFRWRKAYREGRLGGVAEAARFVSAVVHPEGTPLAAAPAGGGRMEIVLADGVRVIVTGTVDAAALGLVLAVLEHRR